MKNGTISWTGHKIGNDAAVLVLQMPPAERILETHFLALLYNPELRYFTVGNGPDLELKSCTFREVTPEWNGRFGGISDPTADSVVAYLCERLDLGDNSVQLSQADAQAFAARVPCFAPQPDVGNQDFSP